MNKDRSRIRLYESLVREHGHEMYRYAYWWTSNAESAEDLVQEAFLEAWRSIHALRDPGRGRAWLLQILRHRCWHWLRDRGRRPRADLPIEDAAEIPDAAPGDPHGAALRNLRLERALSSLEDRYKEPFLMVFLCGFTCRETAMMLDIPVGTVLSRIHRTRLVLRRFVTETPDSDRMPASAARGRAVPDSWIGGGRP